MSSNLTTMPWTSLTLLAAGLTLAAAGLGLCGSVLFVGRPLRWPPSASRGWFWCLAALPLVALGVFRGSTIIAQFEGRPDWDDSRVQEQGTDVETASVPTAGLDTNSARGGILHAQRVASTEPNWVAHPPANWLSVSSQRFSTLPEAERQLDDELRTRLTTAFDAESGTHGRSFPDSLLRSCDISDVVGEVFEHDFGAGGRHQMYRAHALVGLTPEFHERALSFRRADIVTRRLWVLGSIAGLLTSLAGIGTLYYWLDDVSLGRCRRRLQWGALALVAAASLGCGEIVQWTASTRNVPVHDPVSVET